MIHCRDYRSIFPLTATELRRLFLRIDDSKGDCWLWTGSVGGGYGRVLLRGTLWQAHRVVYELLVGPVPPGCVLHHTCGNKRCCNPAHLEVVTQAENVARDWAMRERRPRRLKNYCVKGHEFTQENTLWFSNHGKQTRVCRVCHEAAARRKNEKRRLRRAAHRASGDGSSHG
jgi:hypothetical protein